MAELLFNSWWLPVTLLVLGGIVWYTGNRMVDSRVQRVGVAFLSVGFLFVMLNVLVDTDVKRVKRNSLTLVRSVFEEDWKRTESLLDPDVVLEAPGGLASYQSRDEVLKAARRAAQQLGLRGSNTTIDLIRKEGEGYLVNLRVLADTNATAGHPVPTTWQFQFQKNKSGEWIVREIQAIEVGNGTSPGGAWNFLQLK